MKASLVALAIPLLLISASCKKDPPPVNTPPRVYKENAYELLLLTKKLPDGRVVFQLNKRLFHASAEKAREIYTDTLPALGQEPALIIGEDEDGNPTQTKKIADKEYDVLFKVDALKDADPKQVDSLMNSWK